VNRVRVKICGITQPEDGLFAALEGADAIGLVFYADSPRNIDVDIANSIIDLLPPFVTKVGLFVNAVHADIESILKTVALDMLQFHGEESREDCNRYSLPYIKAVKMVKDIDLFKQAERYHDAVGLLLDTYVSGSAGGTGQLFDWGLISSELDKPIILAGGLNADNVNQAIRKVAPYAVDVSSGVESSTGKKDQEKIRVLIQQVNECKP